MSNKNYDAIFYLAFACMLMLQAVLVRLIVGESANITVGLYAVVAIILKYVALVKFCDNKE